MKKIFLLIALFVGVIGFSQSTSRYRVPDNGPKPQDFYKVMFEFKDLEITDENRAILDLIDLKSLTLKKSEDSDIEIYLENIQKTIIIYSKTKSDQLLEEFYN